MSKPPNVGPNAMPTKSKPTESERIRERAADSVQSAMYECTAAIADVMPD